MDGTLQQGNINVGMKFYVILQRKQALIRQFN